MSQANDSLDDLRREIDTIDDALHDLIVRRTVVVERIRQVKGDGIRLRPAREAQILRRLAARHQGAFPRNVLVRIWRELLGATVRLQGPFSVAVYTGGDDERADYWTLARDEYGAFTPITAYGSQRQVVHTVYEDEATIGILPLPREDDREPWWRFLSGLDARAPRIIARLPFAGAASRRGEAADALAVARLPQQPTGRDRTFLMVETAEALSRGSLIDFLNAAELKPSFLASCRDGDRWLHLAEVDDFVAADDRRLERFAFVSHGALRDVRTVGGYATPLSADELNGA